MQFGKTSGFALSAGTIIAVAVAIILVLPIGDERAAAQETPLPPDQVFRYEITAGADEILLDFAINDGGYLYREKFGFDITTPGVSLGEPRFPPGEIHSDEYFGEQEIYRDEFQLALPYVRTTAADAVELEIRLQGCDDNFGICYPPQRWPETVALPAGALATTAPGGGLGSSIFAGVNSDEPLPIEQAFVPNPRFDSANELTVAWTIAPGYYLYRDKFTFRLDDGEIQFGPPRLPSGVPHTDQNFGDVEVYYDYVEIAAPFARAHPNEQLLSITAGYQGCKDESICYPPAEAVFELTLPPPSEMAGDSAANVVVPATVAEQDFFTNVIVNGSLLLLVGAFFAAGLGLSLTPCVYPMVPILSSIIAGQGSTSTMRSFLLSVSYVLGMAVTYSAAGAITALSGNQVQAVFQQPWILASVAGLFVIMAMAMFGLFEIQMPSAIQSRISALADKQKSGSFLGTAVIGALSALIVTTCVAPPLIVALVAIGQSGDVARGSLALFVLAIGMGTPLLLLGASAGRLLPKVGPWMNVIKAGFGVIMIGMAIWMLDRVLDGTVTLLLWSLLVFLTGVFLGAFEALPPEPRPIRRLAKGVGVLACIYGALMLIGATLGGNDPLRPIPALAGGFAGQATPTEALEFVNVESVAELESLLGSARASGQPVMVDFTADWCVSCREMEESTFPDPTVIAATEPFVLIRIDVTENNEDDQALLAYFQIYGPPTTAFFDRHGEQLPTSYRLFGFVPPDEFSEHVSAVSAL